VDLPLRAGDCFPGSSPGTAALLAMIVSRSLLAMTGEGEGG
jgi:hypothetical protein